LFAPRLCETKVAVATPKAMQEKKVRLRTLMMIVVAAP